MFFNNFCWLSNSSSSIKTNSFIVSASGGGGVYSNEFTYLGMLRLNSFFSTSSYVET